MKVYDNGEAWKKHALCRGMGTELFFSTTTSREAKKVCENCCVKKECFEYGLFHGGDGIWGGVGPNGRQRINVEKRFVCPLGHDRRWNTRLVCYECVNERVVDIDEFSGDFRDIRSWNISYGATKYDL